MLVEAIDLPVSVYEGASFTKHFEDGSTVQILLSLVTIDHLEQLLLAFPETTDDLLELFVLSFSAAFQVVQARLSVTCMMICMRQNALCAQQFLVLATEESDRLAGVLRTNDGRPLDDGMLLGRLREVLLKHQLLLHADLEVSMANRASHLSW